jgi:hypothetical protein
LDNNANDTRDPLEKFKKNKWIALLTASAAMVLAILVFSNQLADQWTKLAAHFGSNSTVKSTPAPAPVSETNPNTSGPEKLPEQPTQAPELQGYKPTETDPNNPVANEMHFVVSRVEGQDHDHFTVQFTFPRWPIPLPNMPPALTDYTSFGVTIAQKLPSGNLRFVPSQIPLWYGDWKSGDKKTVTFDLPTDYTDPGQGWIVRICAGESLRCIPSPNLLAPR